MQWFKHITASGDDPDIDDAVTLFGSDGYYVFFRTLEIMSREFKIENPGVCVFSVQFLRKKYQTSWRKTLKVLEFFSEKNRIILSEADGERLPSVRLYSPKLKDLCDEYTQRRLKKCRDNNPSQAGQAPEQEVEPEVELDTTTLPTEDVHDGDPPAKIKSINWVVVQDHWNHLASENGLSSITEMTDERKRKYRTRTKGGKKQIEFWKVLDTEIWQLSDFAHGVGGNWTMNFDFLLKNSTNIVKLAEGVYRKKDSLRIEPQRRTVQI